MQSLWRRAGEQVRAVRRASSMKVRKVKRQAERVPRGMLLLGEMRSPERLAPAMMPVTPEKRTPKTVKKSTWRWGRHSTVSAHLCSCILAVLLVVGPQVGLPQLADAVQGVAAQPGEGA
jgi:hypothetical protein